MPVMERQTYIAVPPPPLPEFYLGKQDRKDAAPSSSSSSSEHDEDREILEIKGQVNGLDGAYDTKPHSARLAAPPAIPLMAVLPSQMDECNVPPLAIYHICRICLRPRSPRYHREHPIPLDDVPPPPGICRRCRVTSVKDTTKVKEYVVEHRSQPVKLGCFMPFVKDQAIVSQEEMRRIKMERFLGGQEKEKMKVVEKSRGRSFEPRKETEVLVEKLRGRTSRRRGDRLAPPRDGRSRSSDREAERAVLVEKEQRRSGRRQSQPAALSEKQRRHISELKKDIHYRHVRVTEVSEDGSASEGETEERKVVYIRRDITAETEEDMPNKEPEKPKANTKATAKAPAKQPSEPTGKTPKQTTTSQAAKQTSEPPASDQSTNMRKLDSTEASVVVDVANPPSRAGSRSTARASTKITRYGRERSESELRAIARDEIDQYAKTFQPPTQRSESEIRRLAREEVEKYRAAERKLEAHPEPYAHGRLVPVERRIETEKDEAEPMPWINSPLEGAEVTTKHISITGNSKKVVSSKGISRNIEVHATANEWEDHCQADGESQNPAPSAISAHREPEPQDVESSRASQRTRKSSHYEEQPWQDGHEDYHSARVTEKSDKRSRSEHQSWAAASGYLATESDSDAGEIRGHSSHQRFSGRLSKRELTTERCLSVHSAGQESKISKASKAESPAKVSDAKSRHSSVKSREVYDEVDESDSPRRSSRAEPYVRHAARPPRKELYDVVEVVEEVDLPPSRSASYRRPDGARQATGREGSQHQGNFRETDIVIVRQIEKGQAAQSETHGVRSRASRPSRRGSKADDAIGRTVESRASMHYEASRNSEVSQRPIDDASSVKGSTEASYGGSKRSESPASQGSEKTKWPQDQGGWDDAPSEKGSKATTRESTTTLPYPEVDTMPDHESSIARFSQHKSTHRNDHARLTKKAPRPDNSDVDYLYTKRVVTPADKPPGWQPKKRLTVVEEEWSHRKGVAKRESGLQ